MEGKENRKCAFNECLAYHDGKNIHYFYGKHPGNLSEKNKDQTEQKNGQICGIYLNQKDLIKHQQKWMQKKGRIEGKLMGQYKQCRNFQNGMKANNYPYKLQVVKKIELVVERF